MTFCNIGNMSFELFVTVSEALSGLPQTTLAVGHERAFTTNSFGGPETG